MKGKSHLSTQEWICRRHGAQSVTPTAKKNEKPACKWCGETLDLDTWVMSKGG